MYTANLGISDQDNPVRASFLDAKNELIKQIPKKHQKVPNLSSNCCGFNTDKCSKEAWEKIFLISKTVFDEQNSIHQKILCTLYAAITGSSTPAERRGPHWEELGFQSNDPVTDLRATGMMGLVLPLEMFSCCKDFSRRVLETSQAPDHGFPLMIILIVLTSTAIEACGTTSILKGNDFNECWEQMVFFFIGMVDEVCTKWKNESCTIQNNYGLFVKIQQKCLSKPQNTVKNGMKIRGKDNNNSFK